MGKATSMAFLVLVVILQLFASCASSVSLEEFEAYRSDSQDRIGKLELELANIGSKQGELVLKREFTDMAEQMGILLSETEQRLAQIETAMTLLSPRVEVQAMRTQVDLLNRDYLKAKTAVQELLQHAGFDSSDYLVALGHEILEVNTNIENLDAKIENLRAAMALFAQP
ncbi:MAG: hypothetical protein PHN93_04530 [Sphaerochaetaceae bacterium]|nr:hypothetical protein [Sphaerochaetaceae bacterium]